MSQRGNPMLCVRGYTYSNKKIYGSKHNLKKRWVCSTHFHRGCKAVIYTLQDDEDFVYVRSRQGTRLIQFGGYSYGFKKEAKYGQKTYWRCTAHSRGCLATIHTADNKIVKFHMQHNH